ncbi:MULTISPECIES: hypothetical protein [Chryseobacterium]|uniref:Uncharacterized protein n=1 Tax=Chryseobacterium taihuense TaxID=1141221 RepID=A0A4U8WA71_9FLAO|nr:MULTISPECIES: hypothetical protein [Chryseobacterium]VFB03177.1 Uncharacterised protein [Chryseobacterium taihuense]
MKLYHLRNATLVIETQEKFILVDPLLGEKGSGLPFTLIRFKPRKNPLVDLPSNSDISESLDFWKEHDFWVEKSSEFPPFTDTDLLQNLWEM